MSANASRTVLVTGGAGYVGSALIPKLLAANWNVNVLDLYLYRQDVFSHLRDNHRLTEYVGDIRNQSTVRNALVGCESVIHLACISNDPSFELNPDLGRSINYDCFPMLVDESIAAGVQRFVYASSSSVYGVKEELAVTEDLPLQPLTDYSKYKALCEEILASKAVPGFTTVTIRPATVCGFSPRQRLDVIVNILTNHAIVNRKIRVLGGTQTRPNIHIDDMTDLYVKCLEYPSELINGSIFNAGYYNQSVNEIAFAVQRVVGKDVSIEIETSDDNRSYHISSEKISRLLGFRAKKTIEDAVSDLVAAFGDGRIKNSMTDPSYYNIKKMHEISLR